MDRRGRLTDEEKEVLGSFMREVAIKNSTAWGRLMSLHDWNLAMKRERTKFQKEMK